MISDELISAYLDGELSDAERSQVETALNDSAELRRMCDELRELRDRFASLPRWEVREGFAQRVLRQAEREMLTQQSTPATAPPVTTSPSAKPPARRRAPAIALSCVAAAATLLIAITVYQSRTPEVAMYSGVKDSSSSPQDVADLTAETAPDLEKTPGLERGGSTYSYSESFREGADGAESDAATPPQVGEESALSDRQKGSAPQDEYEPTRNTELLQPKDAAPRRALPGNAVNSSSVVESRIGGGRRPTMQAEDNRSDDFAVEQQREALSAQLTGQLHRRRAFVVQVDATRAALRDKLFDQTLVSNQIVMDSKLESDMADVPEELTSRLQRNQDTSFGRTVDEDAVADAEQDDVGQQVELVVVEASADQIAQTLADLFKNREQFPNVVDLVDGRDARESMLNMAPPPGEPLAGQAPRPASLPAAATEARRAYQAPSEAARPEAAFGPATAGDSQYGIGGGLGGRQRGGATGGDSIDGPFQREKALETPQQTPADREMAGSRGPGDAAPRPDRQSGRAWRWPVRMFKRPTQPSPALGVAPSQPIKKPALADAVAADGSESLRMYFLIRPVESTPPAASEAPAAPPPQ